MYRQIADELRHQIAAGDYDRGGLPSEKDLVSTYGTSNATIRAALRELIAQGLILKRAGARTQVRHTPEMARVEVDLAGREVGGRGASEAEAAQYGIPLGSPMLILIEVTRLPDGTVQELEIDAWPADRTRLRPLPD